jgi:anti-sigma-K factor RskA
LNERLPLWRLIAALLVVAAMVAVLAALAPVYLKDYRLGQYMKSVASASNAQDDVVKAEVLERARELDLPVRPEDLQLSHPSGKLEMQMRYAVQMDFSLYQVDVHFHHRATN